MALSRRQVAAVVASVVIVVVVVVVGVAFYTASPRKPPGRVTLEGVEVTIVYAPGSSGSIGPASNDTCPNCPLTLSSGTQSWLQVYGFVVPEGRTVWLNSTLSSAVPFHPESWTGSSPPTLYIQSYVNWTMTAGEGTGFQVQLVVPYSPSASQTTFWVYLNLTANLQPTR